MHEVRRLKVSPRYIGIRYFFSQFHFDPCHQYDEIISHIYNAIKILIIFLSKFLLSQCIIKMFARSISRYSTFNVLQIIYFSKSDNLLGFNLYFNFKILKPENNW